MDTFFRIRKIFRPLKMSYLLIIETPAQVNLNNKDTYYLYYNLYYMQHIIIEKVKGKRNS